MSRDHWILAAAAALSVAALIWMPLPAVWVALLCAGICLLRLPRSRRRFLWFNAALALLALAVIEAALGLQPQAWHAGDYEHADYFDDDPDLGYVARPGQRSTHEKRLGDSMLYSVAYTIEDSGVRRSNPPSKREGGPCVLFFGGSFTFGEGLNDEETFPYLTSLAVGDRLHTLNFGFHGYGPHHILAMIESGRVDRAVDCEPRAAIYLALGDHVFRSAGLRWWDDRGPRYVIGPDGRAHRRGQFNDDRGLLDVPRRFLQKKSEIARRLRSRTRPLEDRDYALHVALVDEMRAQLEATYPGIEFGVILWDVGDLPGSPSRMRAELEERGIEIDRLAEILDQLDEEASDLTIPGDGHPNARANEILARHLESKLP